MANDPILLVLAVACGVLLLALAVLAWWSSARARAAREQGAQSREPEVAALRSQQAQDAARLAEQRTELAGLREAERRALDALKDAAAERARLETRLGAFAPLAADLDALRGQHETLRAEAARLQAALAESRAQADAAQALALDRQRALEQVGERMKLEFEALSTRILDEKGRKFTESNQQQMGVMLGPLREQLEGFRKAVTETWQRDQVERAGLKSELDQLKNLNQRLGDEATALTRALKGEQRVQGRWGEVLLERLLEASGLERGRGFETQVSAEGESGRLRPDAVVHLPDERELVIDAKVSLVAWERWCAASDDAARAAEMKAHVGSLRAHVAGLSERRYADLPGIRSVDFVLMFVPVEAAFVEAARADDELYLYALERNVVIVSSSTLLATLRTVASVWRNEDRNRNALEIAQRAGRLYDKFHGFMADLEKVDRNLRIARESFDEARSKLSSGRGNVVAQMETLQKLGAKASKRLGKDLRAEADAEDAPGDTPPALDPPEAN
jgi:DNA recombination protein RmuC